MTHMRKVTLFLTLALVALLVVGGLCFGADKYPTKPIQVIVPFAAGGSSDLTARTVEKFWTKYSPQPMLIVNKPAPAASWERSTSSAPSRTDTPSMSDRAPAMMWSCRTCRRCPSTP